MKKLLFSLLAITLVTQAAFAQNRVQPDPQMQKEMRAYIEKNVQPVLLKAQKEFDSQLSKEDLTFIQNQRKEVAEKRAAMKDKMEQVRELKEEGKSRDEIKEALGIDPEQHKEARKAQREEIKTFMERNKSLITSTMEELKPSYETWIKEEKAILQKYKPEGDQPREEKARNKKGNSPRIGLFGIMPPKHFGTHEGRKGHHGAKGHRGHSRNEECTHEKKGGRQKGDKMSMENRKKMRGMKLGVQFVLWDGQLPPETAPMQGFGKAKQGQNINKFSLQNYPNPANGLTKITADLPENTKAVTITINDRSGKTVKTLNFKNLDKGFNVFEMDVSNLADGLYFYTFEADGIKTTRRLMVGK